MEKRTVLKSVMKGMVIGIAAIMPGISGGTMAISMGIYDKILYSMTHIISDFRDSMRHLLPIAAGMGIALLASVFGITCLSDAFPLQTNFLFIGLIVGSLPEICKKVKGKSVRAGYLICFVIFYIFIIEMALLNGEKHCTIIMDFSFSQIIILFLIGVIAAATMVIPGVSGSMLLLVLGYYNPILDTIKNFILALFSFDGMQLFETLTVLFPFGAGVLVGTVALAKLVEMVFSKFPLYAYWSIIGLLLASPIAIILAGDLPRLTHVGIITGIVAFFTGFGIAGKLGENNE